MAIVLYHVKSTYMVCFGFELGATGLEAQTNTLGYGQALRWLRTNEMIFSNRWQLRSINGTCLFQNVFKKFGPISLIFNCRYFSHHITVQLML